MASLALVLLSGMAASYLFDRAKLPGILGMLLAGIAIGPYALNLVSPGLLSLSTDIKTIALVIILLKAGLGLNFTELRSVAGSAAKLSCIPAMAEGLGIALLATQLFHFSFLQGGMLGFMVAAVSPAAIVPQMLDLRASKIGTDKCVPTIILAATSIDGVCVITLFTLFLDAYTGSHASLPDILLGIPLSLGLGVLVGRLLGLLLLKMFEAFKTGDTRKTLCLIALSMLLKQYENSLILFERAVPFSSMLGIVVMAATIMNRRQDIAAQISSKMSSVWVFAEIMVFVLVGTEVNLSLVMTIGGSGVLIVLAGLLFRCAGVALSTIGSNLNAKERLFCALAFLPKATVQAAIGGIPLAMGVASGDTMQAISVLSILIAAPLGVIAMKRSYGALLSKG